MVTPAAALDPSKSASHFIEVYGFFKWERWRDTSFCSPGPSEPLGLGSAGVRSWTHSEVVATPTGTADPP